MNSTFKTLILGAGPAGTGPLVCAIQKHRLGQLLDSGVAILDRGSHIGRGTIGQYVINSDTLGRVFLECLDGQEQGVLKDVLTSPARQALEAYRGTAAPLKLVGEYMAELGVALRSVLETHPKSRFFPYTEAQSIHLLPGGGFRTRVLSHDSNQVTDFYSASLVTALGGKQDVERTLHSEIIPGLSPSHYAKKTFLTNVALTDQGVAEIEKRLRSSPNRKVVIIGASHSTFSSAWMLLNKVQVEFGTGDITILHGNKLKLYYDSPAAAHAEGYDDFDQRDLCTLTGRVYRLGGLRFDSAELLKRIWGMRPENPETRIQLVKLDRTGQNNPLDVKALLDEAAVIIPAFGYRPNLVPLYDTEGHEVELLCQGATPYLPLVDEACRVLDSASQPIPNMYGIGLASGYIIKGDLGGEPSFTGQTNGLWLYQNGIGEIILNQILPQQQEA